MGMSASQARLIALTARMNDIEYQGQQINQQRTTLSNQVNSLYNTLLEMSVPTPPSTQDFTKLQYTGTLNASTFTLTSVTPKSDGTYNLKLGFPQSGNIVTNTNKAASIVSTPTEFKVSEAKNKTEIADLFLNKTQAPEKGEKFASFEAIETAATKTGKDDNLMIVITKAQLTDEMFNMTGVSVYIDGKDDSGQTSDGKHLKQITSKADIEDGYNGNIYIVCNASNVTGDDGKVDKTSTLGALITTSGGEYAGNAYSWDEGTWTTTKTNFTEDEKSVILSKNLLIKVDGGARYLKASDINENLSINDLYVIDANGGKSVDNVESETPYSIKNSDGSTTPLYTLDEAKANGTISDTYYDAAIESLKHSFPDIDDIGSAFYVYVEDGEFKFIKTKDTTGITDDKTKYAPVYKQSTGTYSETKAYENCQIEFDNDGKINTIYLTMPDGNVYAVTMSAETITDQEAYENAFNQYEYDKYKYDKEQQEINVKTSIIQAEDKNLELKLTRLDNERNAVNTEIEAVKKVVDDNIQKSFKTFSG